MHSSYLYIHLISFSYGVSLFIFSPFPYIFKSRGEKFRLGILERREVYDFFGSYRVHPSQMIGG